jgi:hypothetical protein
MTLPREIYELREVHIHTDALVVPNMSFVEVDDFDHCTEAKE